MKEDGHYVTGETTEIVTILVLFTDLCSEIRATGMCVIFSLIICVVVEQLGSQKL